MIACICFGTVEAFIIFVFSSIIGFFIRRHRKRCKCNCHGHGDNK